MRAHDPAASQKSACKAEQTPNDGCRQLAQLPLAAAEHSL